MLIKEELVKLAQLDPELIKYLKDNPFPGVPWDDIDALRASNKQGTEQIKAALGNAPHGFEESIRTIKMRDGYENGIRVVRPSTPPPNGSPLILLIHGGGFLMGNNLQMIPLARPLSKVFGAVVVSLAYRLSPEHPFPTSSHDVYDSLKWIVANATALGADPAQGFIVGGSSAGGLLSAVCTQQYLNEGLSPPITGLYQNITCLLADEIVPEKYKDVWISRSQPETADAMILSAKNLDVIYEHLKPDFSSPLFSPFNAKNPHKGMPPTYFQVCGVDPLRDDSFVYEDVLKENGVKTRLDVYPGMPHGFVNIFPTLKLSQKWKIDFIKGIGWLLGKEVTEEDLQSLA